MLVPKMSATVIVSIFAVFSSACAVQAPEQAQIPMATTPILATTTPIRATATPVPTTDSTHFPTRPPRPTENIEGTVEARVNATLAAKPKPTATATPTPTPLPTSTPKPLPTATRKPTPVPTATAVPPSPTYTPEPIITVTESTRDGRIRQKTCARHWNGGITCGGKIRLPDMEGWQVETSNNYASTWLLSKAGGVRLVIRCKDRKTDAFLSFRHFIGFSDPKITYQIDLQPPQKLLWNWSNTRESALYPGEVPKFVTDLMDGETLVMQRSAYDSHDTPTNARFELSGLSSSVAAVRHQCGW